MEASDIVSHPFSFAIGVGVANGCLSKVRGKQIDLKVAATLAAVIGVGEAALVMYEPQSERGKFMSKMSLMEVGLGSIGGLFVGLIPFISLQPSAHGSGGHSLLLAENEPPPAALPAATAAATAAAGFGNYGARTAKRRRRS